MTQTVKEPTLHILATQPSHYTLSRRTSLLSPDLPSLFRSSTVKSLTSFFLLSFPLPSLPFIPSAKATLLSRSIIARRRGENDIPKIICNPVVRNERRKGGRRKGGGEEDATPVLGQIWVFRKLTMDEITSLTLYSKKKQWVGLFININLPQNPRAAAASASIPPSIRAGNGSNYQPAPFTLPPLSHYCSHMFTNDH